MNTKQVKEAHWYEGDASAHLFEGSDDESKCSEDVEIRRSCSDAAYNRLDHKCRHERLLSTELVRQKAEQDSAEHDAKVEYHLRGFR